MKKNSAIAKVESVQSASTVSHHSDVNESFKSTLVPEHLQKLLDNASDELTDNQKKELAHLLIAYEDVFVGPDGKLGRTDLVKHIDQYW